MNQIPTLLLTFVLLFAVWACSGEAGEAATANPTSPAAQSEKPESVLDRVNYSIGLNLGRNLRGQSFDADIDLIVQGLKDGLADSEALLTPEEMQAAMEQFQQELQAQQQAESAAFLESNKAKTGVVTLPSGLQYEVLEEGTGAQPTASDQVKVHYRGTLVNGTQFDSSYDRGEPATFGVGGVIPGWTEALQLMKAGAKWKLVIPANLAYGARGQRGIPPNSTLIFEVELLEVVGK